MSIDLLSLSPKTRRWVLFTFFSICVLMCFLGAVWQRAVLIPENERVYTTAVVTKLEKRGRTKNGKDQIRATLVYSDGDHDYTCRSEARSNWAVGTETGVWYSVNHPERHSWNSYEEDLQSIRITAAAGIGLLPIALFFGIRLRRFYQRKNAS